MRDLAYVRRVRAMLGEVVNQAAVATDPRGLARENASRYHARAASPVTLPAPRSGLATSSPSSSCGRPSLAAVQQRRDHRGALARGTFALVNVNAIPMAGDTVIRDATVLVRDGRIVSIGRNVTIPAEARRIDGRGKIPDPRSRRHAHPPLLGRGCPRLGAGRAGCDAGERRHGRAADDRHAGALHAATRGRGGPHCGAAALDREPAFRRREMPNGRVVTTPEDARAAVKEMADPGYDFIKLTLFITPPVYDAIVDEAKRRIPVVGHVDPQVGVARALEAGSRSSTWTTISRPCWRTARR